jgi:G3E family GTPase
MGTNLGLPDEPNPLLYQVLSRLVRWVCLSRNNKLHRMLGIAQYAKQSLRIVQQQVRSFISGEAARDSQRQDIGIEKMSGAFDVFGGSARAGGLAG